MIIYQQQKNQSNKNEATKLGNLTKVKLQNTKLTRNSSKGYGMLQIDHSKIETSLNVSYPLTCFCLGSLLLWVRGSLGRVLHANKKEQCTKECQAL